MTRAPARPAPLNGDGVLDVATAGLDGVALWYGQDGLRFGSSGNIELPVTPSDAQSADLNADGFRDLVVTQSYGSAITILPGLGGGAFGSAITFDPGGDFKLNSITDLDHDGIPDLVLSGGSGYAAQLVIWNGLGNFQFLQTAIYASQEGLIRATPCDVTGDGILDLLLVVATSSYGGQGLLVALPVSAVARIASGSRTGEQRRSGCRLTLLGQC